MPTIDQKPYDVCIVGAGVAGSTCAWYLARRGLSVLLLEKMKFPRRKICGDAVTARGLDHLERMGVLREIMSEKKGRPQEIGGFVSPGGLVYRGDSAAANRSPLVVAVKRSILDEKMARSAQKAGAALLEGFGATGAEFSGAAGAWTVSCENEKPASFRARVLVAADGAASRLARSLGFLRGGPDAVCSQAYVAPGTHCFDSDGMVYYPERLLPGYCALIREADDSLNFCCYVIPGGRVGTGELRKVHHALLKGYAPVVSALGPKAKIESMRAGPLRLGGVAKSHAGHFLIIGDAAGHIDPLTGEGIQYAMDGAEIAALTIARAFDTGDFGDESMKRYHSRWMDAFGADFHWSAMMARVVARHPVFLDAFAELSSRRGDEFMLQWARIMTGSLPKSRFFLPALALPLLGAVLARSWNRPPFNR